NLAQQEWEVGNVASAVALLERQRPQPGGEELRGFEWRLLWRLCRRGARCTLRGHTAEVVGAIFSPDGRLLAARSRDGALKLWDVPSRRARATLRAKDAGFLTMAISPDGKTLATDAAGNAIQLWDLAARQKVATLHGHTQHVDGLAFSPDGKTLASSSDDGT